MATILIVEDDTFLLTMYADKFRAEAFDVMIAGSGAEALKVIQQKRPDIILLDLMLPGMNGFEILEQLKRMPEFRDVPVILLTNLSQKEDIERGRELGAADFLIKAHFMPNEVVAKVRAILDRNVK